MRRLSNYASFAVAVALCIGTVFAAPAAARRHHHTRRHVPVDLSGADANVVITPSSTPLTLTGQFSASVTVKGALPFDALVPSKTLVITGPLVAAPAVCAQNCPQPCLTPTQTNCLPPPKIIAGIPCGPNALITVIPDPLKADATGTAVGSLVSNGTCVPGAYVISFTETAAPFRTFTGFLTLT